ncbi:tyrosine-type recombinase/integrase [Lactococcus insecticola]|uniref:Site-specific integrase n=1 Tax=Pseudolactococcus insecticola TaxID=2709158 RepID=A0A6A0BC95_9LACT|nr:site-specific integrase [Lactococcus insecticola]GFH41447.1 site-specific integrase [Lactococcus insecticola]
MNIKKVTKKDGSTVYKTSVYLGVDSLTGKKVRTTSTAKTRKMCEIKANQAINKFQKNGSTVATEKVDFADFKALAVSWFDGYKLTVKVNSSRVAKSYLNHYILPALGAYQVDKISPVLLQGIVNQWAKNANTSPIINNRRKQGSCKDYKLLLNFVKRILNHGFQLGAINSNPAVQVVPPKLKQRTTKQIKYFDNDELKRFLVYLDTLDDTPANQMRGALYRFMLATGLRVGETFALSWSDVDFKGQSVSVTKTVLQDRSIQDSTKTRESTRTVTLDNDTLQMLNTWQRQQRQHVNVISLTDSPVFSLDNTVLCYEQERQKLIAMFKRAKVPYIGFHGFRHTHASLLMNANVNPKEIQHRLGHADYAITMNTYSHLSKDKEKDTAEKFGSILKAL